mmetsp:Transcript_39815/g.98444  ORF Transcript_39815/g.98444 Transcript_39815/m.98444 type:complete len:315 (+) Transcript_39815:100-1044(+)
MAQAACRGHGRRYVSAVNSAGASLLANLLRRLCHLRRLFRSLIGLLFSLRHLLRVLRHLCRLLCRRLLRFRLLLGLLLGLNLGLRLVVHLLALILAILTFGLHLCVVPLVPLALLHLGPCGRLARSLTRGIPISLAAGRTSECGLGLGRAGCAGRAGHAGHANVPGLALVLRVLGRLRPPLGRHLEGVAVAQFGVFALHVGHLILHEEVIRARLARRAGGLVLLLAAALDHHRPLRLGLRVGSLLDLDGEDGLAVATLDRRDTFGQLHLELRATVGAGHLVPLRLRDGHRHRPAARLARLAGLLQHRARFRPRV